jgi:hypothetical protein
MGTVKRQRPAVGGRFPAMDLGREEARGFFGSGLRLRWRGAGEARGSVGQALWRERTTADELVRSGLNAGQGRCFRRGCDCSGDELAKRAVVVLMYAWTLRGPVRFGVRPDCGRRDASRCGCIHDADHARQKCLGEGADEYPTANSSRESFSRWCHVTRVANPDRSAM